MNLPDKPLLVLARYNAKNTPPGWYYLAPAGYQGPRFERAYSMEWHYAEDLIVVDHPGNDPRAVEIITGARSAE